MSDRHMGFIVTLDRDYKDEDAADIRQAILMTKGVLGCEPVVTEHHDHINRMRIRAEFEEKIYNALRVGEKATEKI